MEQTIRDLFTQEEWEVFASDANDALAVIGNLPLRMEGQPDEEK